MKLQAKIAIQNINPYVLVSAEQAASLQPGWRKPMPVTVQVNGQPNPAWQINMMPVGDGSFYLYLHESIRKASDTKVGDTVEINLAFDESYKAGPAHPIPEWFEDALKGDQIAKHNWSALPPSRQKEVLRYFDGLKSHEAKQRNLDKALHVLHGHSGRFMARDWKGGR